MSKLSTARIFSTPTYIHSHASALEDVQWQGESVYVTNSMNNIANQVKENIRSAISNLKSYSTQPAVIEWYNSSHETNGKRKIDDDFQELFTLVQKYRNEAPTKADEIITKMIDEIMVQIMSGDGTVYEVLTQIDNIGEELANLVASSYYNKENKKNKTKNFKDITIDDLKHSKKLYKAISGIIRSRLKGFFTTGKSMEDMIKTAQDFIRTTVKLHTEDATLPANEVAKLALDKSRSSSWMRKYVSSGILFEYILILYYYANPPKITINNHAQEGKVQSTGTSGHASTSDLEFIFEDGEDKIVVGMSAKATMSQGKATTTFEKRNVDGSPLPLSSSDYQQMLYVLGNMKALTKFAAPEKYEKVLGKDGTLKVPNKKLSFLDLPTWVTEMQKWYTYTTFIKGLVGEILNTNSNDNFKDNLKSVSAITPPVFLAFLEYDYWMYEILENVLILYEDQVDLSENIIFSKFDFSSPIFKVFTVKKLTSLFLSKKLTQRTTENAYEDYYNNGLEEEASIYGVNQTVLQILTEISDAFNATNLAKYLFPKVSYEFSISNLLKKGGQ